jgi:hypothetical protein
MNNCSVGCSSLHKLVAFQTKMVQYWKEIFRISDRLPIKTRKRILYCFWFGRDNYVLMIQTSVVGMAL